MLILGKKRRLAHASQALVASLLIAFGVASPLPAHAQGGLPTLGDGSDLTSSEERRLGDRIIRELYRDPDYIDDPVIGEYVQGIWQPLMAAARARGELSPELDERFAWEVLLGRDRTVNAFALPGGYLGLHLGLIGVVGTRDELASVMAHELSHVTQRHISRLLTQQSRQTPLLLGAMVLGALAASKNPGATQALVVGGQALAIQHKWGQTPINLSGLIGVRLQLIYLHCTTRSASRGPSLVKMAHSGPSQLLHVTDLACYSATCNDFPGEFHGFIRCSTGSKAAFGDAHGGASPCPNLGA